MPLTRIMVIIDPTADQQPAFARALDSGRMTGARLHLYLCAGEEPGPDEPRAELLLDQCRARAEEAGVEASIEFERAADWSREAVSAAARCGASMVFKNSFDHSAVQRELRDTSDWTLMRLSPCPVLLVKNFHNWKHRRVLAAVNPESTDEAHIRLNQKIVSLAQNFSGAYGSDAHFVTAFHDLNNPPDAGEIARACGASPDNVHLAHGRASDVIRDTAAELDVDLVILGTVARSGIKGRVVGNTSERLLDQTHSDLLVLN